MKPLHYRPTFFLALLLLVLMAMGTACGPLRVASNPPTPTPPPDIAAVVQLWSSLSEIAVSPEKNTILEVWYSLSQDFVEKGNLDASALSQAAMNAMLDVPLDGEGKADPNVLSNAAIEAMLDTLGDPYTSFLDPHEYQLYVEDSQGKFEGIGARVDLVDARVTVVEPMPNTPAERAGIKAGDVILEIDGVSTEGWSLMESVLKIRGPKGTSVRLLVQHQDVREPVLIEIVRAVIQLDSIRWEMLPGKVAYLKVNTFADDTDEILADILKEVGKQEAQGIVLDVRNNLGGFLSTAVNVASQFLKDGLVLYSTDGDGKRTEYKVKPGGLAQDIPLVVLVNRHSASASEVLSGALQDHKRAVLIGTTTFGKGSVNQPKRLSDGSGLYVTIGRWYTPQGRLIEGYGLEPDVWVAASATGYDDPQLERALEYLGAQVTATSR
ncbi:MAG: S41 family peptidase [Chloroflexi bacterium]|nr:S41 family peptidase [Chloroflexota bacterium]